MLQYDRIDISEGIDTEKTNASKECKIYHYWYFKDISFKYESHLCNGCHGLMQKAVSFNNIAIVYVKDSAYRIRFWYMSKNYAIKIMNNSSLIDKMGVLKILFIMYINMSGMTYCQRNRDVILNRAKDYYENEKERLREKARNKYRNLSEEDKNNNKKKEYGRSRNHNMSKEEKNKN